MKKTMLTILGLAGGALLLAAAGLSDAGVTPIAVVLRLAGMGAAAILVSAWGFFRIAEAKARKAARMRCHLASAVVKF